MIQENKAILELLIRGSLVQVQQGERRKIRVSSLKLETLFSYV